MVLTRIDSKGVSTAREEQVGPDISTCAASVVRSGREVDRSRQSEGTVHTQHWDARGTGGDPVYLSGWAAQWTG